MARNAVKKAVSQAASAKSNVKRAFERGELRTGTGKKVTDTAQKRAIKHSVAGTSRKRG